jgi:hypothetical protein
MSHKRVFDVNDIARSNYLWRESKTRINIVLSVTIVLLLLGVFAFP